MLSCSPSLRESVVNSFGVTARPRARASKVVNSSGSALSARPPNSLVNRPAHARSGLMAGKDHQPEGERRRPRQPTRPAPLLPPADGLFRVQPAMSPGRFWTSPASLAILCDARPTVQGDGSTARACPAGLAVPPSGQRCLGRGQGEARKDARPMDRHADPQPEARPTVRPSRHPRGLCCPGVDALPTSETDPVGPPPLRLPS